jgi:long-chain acyl-CoA synthetase
VIKTLPQMLAHTLENYPKPDFMLYKKADKYIPLSTEDFVRKVRYFSLGLKELGIKAGEKVAILSENRPEWVITDQAVLNLRGITVPIYTTLVPDQIKFIIDDSDARVVVCSGQELWQKVATVRQDLNKVEHFILFENDDKAETLFMQDVLEKGEQADKLSPQLYENLGRDVQSEDVATIIYTSGTTGVPKGAMLSQGNLISNAQAVLSVIDVSEADTVLSFLPLSHIFERWAMICYMYVGATIGFAESIDALSGNMLEIRPTVMVTAPRLLEKIYARVLDTVLTGSLIKKAIFYWAVDVGRAFSQKTIQKQAVPGGLRFKRKIANKLVFSKIYAKTGGRMRFFVSGGAPLAKEIGEFFYALGLVTIEGYGLTETSPCITCNRLDDLKYGSVGKPLPGVEVKIAEDGEIWTRGPNVMIGYYKNEAATKDAFEGDWFKTGDVGHIDEQGFLIITDRKKDLIVTSGGKNVAPQPIENLLKSTTYILNAVVVGDRRKFVSALIVPDFDKIEYYAKQKGISFEDRTELVQNKTIIAFIQLEVEKAQANLSRYEKVKKIILLDKEFDLESGEITPSLKVKRHMIDKKYRTRIDALYED